jgi:hypothetical protein
MNLAREAEIQQILRSARPDLGSLRQRTKDWTVADFEYAETRIEIDIYNDMLRGEVFPLLNKLHEQRREHETQERRHREMLDKMNAGKVISSHQSGGITAETVNNFLATPPTPTPVPQESFWKKWWIWFAGATAVIASGVAILEYAGVKPPPIVSEETNSKRLAPTPTNSNSTPSQQPTVTNIPVQENKQPPIPDKEQQPMFNKKPDLQQPTTKIDAGDSSVVSSNQQGGITVGTMNVNMMQPMVEGVRVSMRQIPSPREDAPYAIEITVQVSSAIQPVAIGVV